MYKSIFIKMKILLVNLIYPFLSDKALTSLKGLRKSLTIKFFKSLEFKPINLPLIATLTPKKHFIEIKEYHRLDDIDYNVDFDLIGFSCTTLNCLEAYKIADEFRRRGKTVVLGGCHPSALPDEAKEHADSVVVGEAEYLWLELLKDFEEKKLKPFYRQDRVVNPKDIPKLAYSFSKKKTFVAGIQTSRGCPVGCEFCAITNQRFGRIFRKRPVENVIDEIKTMPQKFINFHDSSFTIDKNYTKSLFKEMKGLNKIFRCWMNADIPLEDEEFLKFATEAGCVAIEIGFESISQDTLNTIGKKTNRAQYYKQMIKKIHDYGIATGGTFVFGFDNDKKDVFKNVLDFINSSDLDIPRYAILTPFPGTKLFERLEREGRIFDKDWTKYDFGNVVFHPKHMTAEELKSGYYSLAQDVHCFPQVVKRILRYSKLKPSSWLWKTVYNIGLMR